MANYDGQMDSWYDKVKDKIYEVVDAQAREDLQGKADASSLATVATSGDYDDLLNKPTIPVAQVNADWNASSGVAEILNKPTLSDVATSGEAVDVSYDNTSSGWQTTNVQSTLDGLISSKIASTNPIGTGSLSLNSGSLTGENAVSIGNGNQATGVASFSSGGGKDLGGGMIGNEPNLASGSSAHAMGGGCEASGDFSFAQGYGLEASSDYQHCIGKFNVPDPNNTYAEIVGNGTGFNATSNARTLDWNGNETLQGDLTIFEGSANEMDVSTAIAGKQDALTAGTNISISNNTISATDTKPTGYDTADVSSKALASSANWSNISSVNITAGTWLINYGVNFPSQGSGNTGHRGVGISVESGTSAPAINMRQCTPAITQDNYTTLAGLGIRVATGNETVYLNARQTSGSSMNVAGRLRVIKIL